MLELQQEKALRYDAEKKLEEMRSECDSCRSKVAKLQDDFKKYVKLCFFLFYFFDNPSIPKTHLEHTTDQQ